MTLSFLKACAFKNNFMFIKTERVATLLKCSAEKVYDLVKNGVLTPVFSFEGHDLFDEQKVLKYKDLRREFDSINYRSEFVPKYSLDELLRRKIVFQTQEERVFRSFSQKPKTMLMVAIETGIERANICWIVLELSKAKRIQLTRKQRCAISKYQAGYYTTDPELFTKVEQLTLFKW